MPEAATDIALVRRANVQALYREFAARALGSSPSGAVPPRAHGLEQAFAREMEISPSMWSMIKSSRPIGDKLARQIESHAGRPEGWLDLQHEESAAEDAALERLVGQIRAAWSGLNAQGRRELRRSVREVVDNQALQRK
jgi:hypothetical protein